eukprot:scaffold1734_cov113-Isochrysis_galbana.AAC.25
MEPSDMAPVQKRRTISLAGSTSSSGMPDASERKVSIPRMDVLRAASICGRAGRVRSWGRGEGGARRRAVSRVRTARPAWGRALACGPRRRRGSGSLPGWVAPRPRPRSSRARRARAYAARRPGAAQSRRPRCARPCL